MKYRRKPVEIEAVIWNGENIFEIRRFVGEKLIEIMHGPETLLFIDTLEGHMRVSLGDYIIRGVKGEFYPCKPDIFKLTYEEI